MFVHQLWTRPQKLMGSGSKGRNWEERENVLGETLVLHGGELGCTGRHDGVGGGDVGLLLSEKGPNS